MRSTSVWILSGLILGLGGLWSTDCAPVDPDTASSDPRLEVEYDGCAAVAQGPVCFLGEGRGLRFWVPSPPGTRLEIVVDGTQPEVSSVAVDGGRRLAVEVPEKASRVVVRAMVADASGEDLEWTLALKDLPPWLKEAFRLTASGDTDTARQLVESTPAASPVESSVARYLLGRFGNEGGDRATALGEAIEVHHTAGNLLALVRDVTVLTHLDIQSRRFAEAREKLAGLELPPGSPADAVYLVAYYRAVLAAEVGDYRSALREIEVAVAQAQRLEMAKYEWWAEQWRGLQLRNLGRSEEAAGVFHRLGEGAPSLCERAGFLINQAWSLFLAMEAGEKAEDPLPFLNCAEEITAQADCSHLRLDLLLNRALVLLHGDQYAEVTRLLAQARGHFNDATPLHRLWWLDIEARLALHLGRPTEAFELYSRLDALAETAFAPEGRWRAAVGQARAQAASGDVAQALVTLEEAEKRLDDESLQIPLHEGRERFVAQRQAGTLLHLDLLLQANRNREAMDVARRSRVRFLRTLWLGERLAQLGPDRRQEWDQAVAAYRQLHAELDAIAGNDWQLPADRLSAVRAEREKQYSSLRNALDRVFAVVNAVPSGSTGGADDGLPVLLGTEVNLVYHPLNRGWVGFAAIGQRVRTHVFELPEDVVSKPEEVAERLLEPFRTEILQATKVRVLPYGALRQIDFHALPFGPEILLAARPVAYGLDIVTPGGAYEGNRRGLVVADPRGDLPASRREAVTVEEALKSLNWRVGILQGSRAVADTVRSALSGVDLLHYAGHGTYTGRGGWDSALPLARSTRFTVGDILLLNETPAWVVLSGCETGRSPASAPLESLGLAQAFVVAGSRSVVAATRPVGDRAAAGLFAYFYQEWENTPDLPRLLQQAQLAWRRDEPGNDWASFRVIEP